jgi:hypothetical protein
MAASQPSEVDPWDAPVPGTLQRSVDQSVRLEEAARRERPALSPSAAPAQAPPSATLIPAESAQAESVPQAPPVRLEARPQIGIPRARPPEPTLAFASFEEDEGPSLEDMLDLEERRLLRPRRLKMWALGFGLAGMVIAVILAGVATAVIVGTDLLENLQTGSVQSTLPPLTEAPAAEPAPAPVLAQAKKPSRPRPKATRSPPEPAIPVVEAAVAGAGAVLDQLEPPVVQPEELQVADLPPPEPIAADEIEVGVEAAPEPAVPRSAPPPATLRPKMQAEPDPEG